MPSRSAPRHTSAWSPDGSQLVITRTFAAPAALVYEAMTNPEHIRQWWGAGHGEVTICEVDLLVGALRQVPEVKVLMPAGTFYAFPDVSAICRRLGITSHGLAMFLLEAAADHKGVACLGGECFGPAGQGFLRFSCAEPDERLLEAVAFLREAVTRQERVVRYLDANPKYRLV